MCLEGTHLKFKTITFFLERAAGIQIVDHVEHWTLKFRMKARGKCRHQVNLDLE